MSNMSRLDYLVSELSKLAHTLALSGDFQGFKDIKVILEGIKEGNNEAIDKGFRLYNTLTIGDQ